jgi:hypothetical protein
MSQIVAIVVFVFVTWLAAAVMSRLPPWKGRRIFDPERLAWRAVPPMWLAMLAGWTGHDLWQSRFPNGNGDLVPVDWVVTFGRATAATVGV